MTDPHQPVSEDANFVSEQVNKARAFINDNSAALTMMAVVMLGGALVSLATGIGAAADDAAVREAYYYDLNTGRLFLAPDEAFPPVDAPSGPWVLSNGVRTTVSAGVKAHVFSCGNCADVESRYVGYLERYSWPAKYAMENADEYFGRFEDPQKALAAETVLLSEGHLIARIPEKEGEPVEWLPAMSDAGLKIEADAYTSCDDGDLPAVCAPVYGR